MSFKKAIKEQAKLRLALCGLAGSGKTFSALSIADALADLMKPTLGRRGRVAAIDTEHESASLYADKFDFDTCQLDSHSPMTYVDKLREAAEGGYDICVIDSLSHAWAGKGGALEQKDSAAARGGNSWTAWRDITPKHNALVDAMLASPMHIIATMRTKMEYIQTTGANGKAQIEKVGLAAIQREGMEYEFTIVGDMDLTHALKITKTRLDGVLDLGQQFDRPGKAFAARVYGWLTSGAAPRPREPEVTRPASAPDSVAQPDPAVDQLHAIDAARTQDELRALIPQLSQLTGEALAEGRRRYTERMSKLEAQAS